MKERIWCFSEGDEGGGGGEAAPAPASVTVEEMTIEAAEPAEPAAPAEPPRDELEVGFEYGRLIERMAHLEAKHEEAMARLAAFEAATVAVLEAEQDELEQHAEVLADVAEEVLPPEHDGANALNPEHQAHKPHWWEAFAGGNHR